MEFRGVVGFGVDGGRGMEWVMFFFGRVKYLARDCPVLYNFVRYETFAFS